MRTRLLRTLTAAAFSILPFAAVGADDKTPMICTPASAIGLSGTAPSCPRMAQTQAVPQSTGQTVPYVVPLEGPPHVPYEVPPEGPPPLESYVVPQAIPPAQPTLEVMVAELQTLRDKEKKLSEAIREKIKAQRKATDDAEHFLNGEVLESNRPSTPTPVRSSTR